MMSSASSITDSEMAQFCLLQLHHQQQQQQLISSGCGYSANGAVQESAVHPVCYGPYPDGYHGSLSWRKRSVSEEWEGSRRPFKEKQVATVEAEQQTNCHRDRHRSGTRSRKQH